MSAPSPAAPRRFRPELHGLRGTAIALVVVYHVWVGRVSGGVDVFLLLSSFLLTGTIIGRLERGDAVRAPSLIARTFQRLLAPAAVVVVATLLGCWAWMPPSTWRVLLDDALGSLLHVENWVLVSRSVDYGAQDAGASPFQHLWSLSVQGQIFLLWPLLMAAAGRLATAVRLRPRPVLVALFCVLGAASLIWSVLETSARQPVAYFDTAARAWEFAAGSLLALLLPGIEARLAARPGPNALLLRVAAGWAGLLGLVLCGIVLDVQAGFPGWIAAWPIACAALVLIAGTTGVRASADALLSTRPAAFLGDVAYALYLVHWPLLVLWLAASGRPRAGLLDGAALIGLSLLLAHLLTRLVDTPVRRLAWAQGRPARAAAVALLGFAVGAVPAAGAEQLLDHRREQALATAARDNPGARVLAPGHRPDPAADASAPVIPLAPDRGRDWTEITGECTGPAAPQDDALLEQCTMTPGPEDAPVLVVVGSSRMQQHAAALLPLARQHGWRVMALWRSSCPYAPGVPGRGAGCDAFNDAVAAHLEQRPPAAVATTTTLITYDPEERVSPGMEETLRSLAAQGTPVLAFRDMPRLVGSDPTGCLDAHGPEDPRCAVPAARMFAPQRPDGPLLAQVAAEGGTVIPVDMTAQYCPGGTCPFVIGNVAVYLDRHHVGATYAGTTSGELERQLERAGWRW